MSFVSERLYNGYLRRKMPTIVSKVVESNPGAEVAEVAAAEVAAASPPLPGANGIDDDVCLSKPGELVSVRPPHNGRPAASEPAPPAQPYSGDSGRLQFSDATTEPSGAGPHPARSAPPCQEDGVPLSRNEPEENHYQGRSSEVMTHVVHVSEGASVLDLDGQSPAPARIANGEAAEDTSGPCGPAGVSPQPKMPQDSEKKTAAHAKYIVTAAGVAACALVLAWRFRN